MGCEDADLWWVSYGAKLFFESTSRLDLRCIFIFATTYQQAVASGTRYVKTVVVIISRKRNRKYYTKSTS